ncbi:MAG: YceI family protein [Melioribacteraceae bacterium]|nr:YceI family protein [Melioribacteraceae bacterium]
MLDSFSDAPLEDFDGITNNIDGYMYLKSLEDLSDNQLYFEVDLTTLDTGIDLRNRHMRDNYLETEKYRFTYFEGSIQNIEEIESNLYEVTVAGQISIHGVTKNMEATGTLKEVDNGFIAKTNFDVSLPDFKIDIPQFMFMKIDEVMKLELEFHLKHLN